MIQSPPVAPNRGLTLLVLEKLTAQFLFASKSDKYFFLHVKAETNSCSAHMCLEALVASLRSAFGDVWGPEGAFLLMVDFSLEHCCEIGRLIMFCINTTMRALQFRFCCKWHHFGSGLRDQGFLWAQWIFSHCLRQRLDG